MPLYLLQGQNCTLSIAEVAVVAIVHLFKTWLVITVEPNLTQRGTGGQIVVSRLLLCKNKKPRSQFYYFGFVSIATTPADVL